MVHVRKEDASLKKCRITLLQLFYGAGQRQSPQLCDSMIPASVEHPVLFVRTKVRWGWGGAREDKTQKGKQNTTLLQVKVLMPIILFINKYIGTFRNGSVLINSDM